mmetsp:Transcript_5899/g.21563  ORF Transcript_5899/g.21563 Transcript_5899/m.21563 type:complete len:202 (+) Transcript_5899:958-1563(+)
MTCKSRSWSSRGCLPSCICCNWAATKRQYPAGGRRRPSLSVPRRSGCRSSMQSPSVIRQRSCSRSWPTYRIATAMWCHVAPFRTWWTSSPTGTRMRRPRRALQVSWVIWRRTIGQINWRSASTTVSGTCAIRWHASRWTRAHTLRPRWGTWLQITPRTRTPLWCAVASNRWLRCFTKATLRDSPLRPLLWQIWRQMRPPRT